MIYPRSSFDATFENLADKHFVCDLSQLALKSKSVFTLTYHFF